MARRDQDMVEVQNWLGRRNANEAYLTIKEQLLVVKKLETQTQHLTDVILDDNECKIVHL